MLPWSFVGPSKVRRSGLRWLLSGFALIAWAGCAGPTRGLKDPAMMQTVVLKAVPVGSSLEDAQRFMEKEGFVCSRQIDSEFGDRKRMDYLYCSRSEGGIVKREWKVAIVHRGGKVTEVLTSTGLTGP